MYYFVLLNCKNHCCAQTMGYDAIATNKDIKISLTDLIGNWYTTDSSASMISFINISNYFVDIEGFNHRVGGNYSFRVYGDSMTVNGTAPNWPPYNCSLRLLNNNHLEIEFYQFLSTVTTKIIYRRSNNE